jgi:glycosyltransferase involved in cell wall biosynthesis
MQLVLSLDPGGTERLVVELVQRLAPRMRMVVCCLDTAGAWAAGLGVPVVALGRQAGFQPRLGGRIAAVAAAHGAGIIHAHHYSPFVYGTLARLWNRRLRLIYTEHGRLSDAPPRLKRRIANAWLDRAAGPVFSVSAALRDHMLAEGFGSHVGVIHNGIEIGPAPGAEQRLQARRALGVASSDRLIVGTVARLDPVKDLTTLIAAVGQLAAQGVPITLAIVGDGPERAAIETAAAAAPADAVRLLGHRDDVRALLPGFDIYANSSVSEGISLTILEAMAAALPVVATRVGGTPEVVMAGQTGLLVEARSVPLMAGAIVGLARSGEQRAALGAAGRQRVETAFTIERMTEAYAREYVRLMPG